MPLTIPNSFSPNTTILSAAVNANFAAISTLMNSTLLDSTYIQTGGIATSNLAANSVTGAKLASSAADGVTLQYTSSTLSIKTGGVDTAQIADGAVTAAKKAVLGQQISSSSGSFSSTSSSFASVTNLTVTITTGGRPVWVGLIPSTSTSPLSSFGATRTGTSSSCTSDMRILRDATLISAHTLNLNYASANATHQILVPVGAIWTIDVVGAGTYTYLVQVKSDTNDTISVNEAKLVAFEL